MPSAIAKWGNSLALRLPRSIAENAGLKDGTPVTVTLDGDRLVVRRSRTRLRLADLLAMTKPRHRRTETDWGAPRGKEIW